MNRWLIIVVALITILALVSGCGRSKTYSGPGGKVTVTPEKGGQKVKVESKDGSYEYTADQNRTISEAELGVPVYPGAKLMMEGDWKGVESGNQSGVEQKVLFSPDSFEKVNEFYKKNLKDIQTQQTFSEGDNKTSMFTLGKDGRIMVHLSWDSSDKRTLIQVMKQGNH